MKNIVGALLMLISSPLFPQQVEITRQIDDLLCYGTIGYRQQGNDFSFILNQGSLVYTGRADDFGIMGPGFFRYFDEETGKYYFSRNGRLIDVNGDRRSVNNYSFATEMIADTDSHSPDAESKSFSSILGGNTGSVSTNNLFFASLFIPAKDAVIKSDDGVYFEFSKVETIERQKVVRATLELANVLPLDPLERLKASLDTLEMTGRTKFGISIIRESAIALDQLKRVYNEYLSNKDGKVPLSAYLVLLEQNRELFVALRNFLGQVNSVF